MRNAAMTHAGTRFFGRTRWHVLRVWNGDVYDVLDRVVELVCEVARMRMR